MIGQAYEDGGFWETAQQSSVAVEPNRPGQTRRLANEIQRLMGDDAQPDPLFFEESWTLGAPTAVQNLRRRLRQQAEWVPQSLGFREFDNPGAQSYVQQREWYADLFPSTQDDAVTGQPIADWPLWCAEEPAARTEDSSREWEPLTVECVRNQATSDPIPVTIPMTLRLACRLLGVTADSPWPQIKTAYRRMVGQWHPDRLQHSSEETRRVANDQTIAINQAYRLLRERMMQQAA